MRRGGAGGPHPQDGQTRANEKRPGGRRSCPFSGAQARRAFRHADIPWNAEVDDPREGAWVVHDHLGLLGGLAAAFSTGCRSLRRAEDFFADLGLGARRALGLGRGNPCDTTLYRLLSEQSAAGMEETVFAQVKELHRPQGGEERRLRGRGDELRRQGNLVARRRPKVEGARQSSTTPTARPCRRSARSAPRSPRLRCAPASGRRPSAPRKERRPHFASCSRASATSWAGSSGSSPVTPGCVPARTLRSWLGSAAGTSSASRATSPTCTAWLASTGTTPRKALGADRREVPRVHHRARAVRPRRRWQSRGRHRGRSAALVCLPGDLRQARGVHRRGPTVLRHLDSRRDPDPRTRSWL